MDHPIPMLAVISIRLQLMLLNSLIVYGVRYEDTGGLSPESHQCIDIAIQRVSES